MSPWAANPTKRVDSKGQRHQSCSASNWGGLNYVSPRLTVAVESNGEISKTREKTDGECPNPVKNRNGCAYGPVLRSHRASLERNDGQGIQSSGAEVQQGGQSSPRFSRTEARNSIIHSCSSFGLISFFHALTASTKSSSVPYSRSSASFSRASRCTRILCSSM